MYMMKGALALFISLALGYIMCILADKQKGILRVVGYTLGAAIIIMSLLFGAYESNLMCMKDKAWGFHKGMKIHPGMCMKGNLR